MDFAAKVSEASASLGRWSIFAAIYAAVSLGVAYARPQRVMNIGDPWCFDGWCLEVEHVDSMPHGENITYDAKLRIYSTAKRISQRAEGAWIFAIDPQGHRYAPVNDPAATPLDVQLAPEQSIETSRRFEVPANVHDLGLITGHGGSYCSAMTLLIIIGQGGCLFHRPRWFESLSTSYHHCGAPVNL